jgi:DNA-directed RNA polymerase specialized sigma subunit
MKTETYSPSNMRQIIETMQRNSQPINPLLAHVETLMDQKLSDRERKVLYLFYWQNYSFTEIATLIPKISPQIGNPHRAHIHCSVVRRLHDRAMGKLKRFLPLTCPRNVI